MNSSKITVLVTGALTVGMGVVGILAGVGVLPHGRADPTVPVAQQQAVAVCIGVVFAAGGAAAMLTACPWRWARAAKDGLGLVIVVGLTALLGWVALGPGARPFASPLAVLGPGVNAGVGRVMFGLGALLGVVILALMLRGMARGRRDGSETA